MMFSDKDKVLIKNLYLLKGYRPTKLMREFPKKNWKKCGLDKLLRKIRETGKADGKKNNRPRSVRTEENVSSVEELALRKEGQPQTHCSMLQICTEIGLYQSSVFPIIHNYLGLKCVKKRRAQELTQIKLDVRLQCARKLLKMIHTTK